MGNLKMKNPSGRLQVLINAPAVNEIITFKPTISLPYQGSRFSLTHFRNSPSFMDANKNRGNISLYFTIYFIVDILSFQPRQFRFFDDT